MFLRARDYGLRRSKPLIRTSGSGLMTDPGAALAKARKADVPDLYWNRGRLGLGDLARKDQMDLVADGPDRGRADPPGARAGRAVGPAARSRSS